LDKEFMAPVLLLFLIPLVKDTLWIAKEDYKSDRYRGAALPAELI
jgi:hypothetical protein